MKIRKIILIDLDGVLNNYKGDFDGLINQINNFKLWYKNI